MKLWFHWLFEFCWDYWHGAFLHRGMKISVMAYAPLTQQWLVRRTHAHFILDKEMYTTDHVTVWRADEDITWCRGWEGEQVAAIQVAQALA